jgi:hypothetical protein
LLYIKHMEVPCHQGKLPAVISHLYISLLFPSRLWLPFGFTGLSILDPEISKCVDDGVTMYKCPAAILGEAAEKLRVDDLEVFNWVITNEKYQNVTGSQFSQVKRV